jgi:predicted RNase H-like HicB family nuclease
MERIVNVRIEKLPEGVFLATSGEVQGLVAQGRTITETLEIARDIVRRLLEAQAERDPAAAPPIAADAFDYPLIIGD